MPGRFNFQSPGAAATDELTRVLAERETKRRQDFLDSLTLKRENRNDEIQHENLKLSQESRAAVNDERAQKEATSVAGLLQPDQQISAATVGLLDKGHLNDLHRVSNGRVSEAALNMPQVNAQVSADISPDQMTAMDSAMTGKVGDIQARQTQGSDALAPGLLQFTGTAAQQDAKKQKDQQAVLGSKLKGVTDRKEATRIVAESGVPYAQIDDVVNAFMGKQGSSTPVKVVYRNAKGENVEKYVSPEDALTMGEMHSPTPSSVVVNTGKQEDLAKQGKTIGDAILAGKMLMDPEGLTRQGVYAAVVPYLLEHGADVGKLRLQAIAAKENTKHLNNNQQQRVRQDIDVIDRSLDMVDTLADKWNAPMWGPLSRITLNQAKDGTFGAEAKTAANQLSAQVQEVRARLASVYQNGGAPTQEAQKRADSQIAEWMDAPTMHDMTKLARFNTNIQKSAMLDTGPVVGGGADNAPSNDTKSTETPEARIARLRKAAGL